MWGKWIFREITAPEKLVLNNSFSDAEGNLTRHPMSATWPQEMLTTSVLADHGDTTALTLTWSVKDCPEIERQTFMQRLQEWNRAGAQASDSCTHISKKSRRDLRIKPLWILPRWREGLHRRTNPEGICE